MNIINVNKLEDGESTSASTQADVKKSDLDGIDDELNRAQMKT